MRRLTVMGLTAALMLLGGAAIFLSDRHDLPLWAVWLIGPFLWFLGVSLALVWGYRFFLWLPEAVVAEAPQRAVTPVVPRRVPVNTNLGGAPAGVLHEIPAMGGFIY